LPPTRKYASEHNEYLKKCLETGILGSGEKIDVNQHIAFEKTIAAFDEKNYPETIPQELVDMCCNVFGHICPVVFSAERFTETSEERRIGRYIPFKTKIRVVRRDNYTCHQCGKHLRDDEVEFDHIIPVAKGGSSDEHNLRLTCFECNRGKSDTLDI